MLGVDRWWNLAQLHRGLVPNIALAIGIYSNANENMDLSTPLFYSVGTYNNVKIPLIYQSIGNSDGWYAYGRHKVTWQKQNTPQ